MWKSAKAGAVREQFDQICNTSVALENTKSYVSAPADPNDQVVESIDSSEVRVVIDINLDSLIFF